MDQNSGKSKGSLNDRSEKMISQHDLKMEALNRLQSMEWKRNQSDDWHLARSGNLIEKGQGYCGPKKDEEVYFKGFPKRHVHTQKKEVPQPVFIPQIEIRQETVWEKKKGAELFKKSEGEDENAILERVIAESIVTAEKEKKNRAVQRQQLCEPETYWTNGFSVENNDLALDDLVDWKQTSVEYNLMKKKSYSKRSGSERSKHLDKNVLESKESMTASPDVNSFSDCKQKSYSKKQDKLIDIPVLEKDTQMEDLVSHVASSLNICKDPNTVINGDEGENVMVTGEVMKSKIYNHKNTKTKTLDSNGEQHLVIDMSSLASDKEIDSVHTVPETAKFQGSDSQIQARNKLTELINSLPNDSPIFELLLQHLDQLKNFNNDSHQTFYKYPLQPPYASSNEFSEQQMTLGLPHLTEHSNIPSYNLPYAPQSTTSTLPNSYPPQFSTLAENHLQKLVEQILYLQKISPINIPDILPYYHQPSQLMNPNDKSLPFQNNHIINNSLSALTNSLPPQNYQMNQDLATNFLQLGNRLQQNVEWPFNSQILPENENGAAGYAMFQNVPNCSTQTIVSGQMKASNETMFQPKPQNHSFFPSLIQSSRPYYYGSGDPQDIRNLSTHQNPTSDQPHIQYLIPEVNKPLFARGRGRIRSSEL